MSIRGPEIEGRTFAKDKLPRLEKRKASPGEIEGFLRDNIYEVESLAGEHSIFLCEFDYSPTVKFNLPEEELILEENKDEAWEKLFNVMQEHGFNQDNLSLIKKHWEGWILEVRKYPTNYGGVFFESLTTVREVTKEVSHIRWYVTDSSFPEVERSF